MVDEKRNTLSKPSITNDQIKTWFGLEDGLALFLKWFKPQENKLGILTLVLTEIDTAWINCFNYLDILKMRDFIAQAMELFSQELATVTNSIYAAQQATIFLFKISLLFNQYPKDHHKKLKKANAKKFELDILWREIARHTALLPTHLRPPFDPEPYFSLLTTVVQPTKLISDLQIASCAGSIGRMAELSHSLPSQLFSAKWRSVEGTWLHGLKWLEHTLPKKTLPAPTAAQLLAGLATLVSNKSLSQIPTEMVNYLSYPLFRKPTCVDLRKGVFGVQALLKNQSLTDMATLRIQGFGRVLCQPVDAKALSNGEDTSRIAIALSSTDIFKKVNLVALFPTTVTNADLLATLDQLTKLARTGYPVFNYIATTFLSLCQMLQSSQQKVFQEDLQERLYAFFETLNDPEKVTLMELSDIGQLLYGRAIPKDGAWLHCGPIEHLRRGFQEKLQNAIKTHYLATLSSQHLSTQTPLMPTTGPVYRELVITALHPFLDSVRQVSEFTCHLGKKLTPEMAILLEANLPAINEKGIQHRFWQHIREHPDFKTRFTDCREEVLIHNKQGEVVSWSSLDIVFKDKKTNKIGIAEVDGPTHADNKAQTKRKDHYLYSLLDTDGEPLIFKIVHILLKPKMTLKDMAEIFFSDLLTPRPEIIPWTEFKPKPRKTSTDQAPLEDKKNEKKQLSTVIQVTQPILPIEVTPSTPVTRGPAEKELAVLNLLESEKDRLDILLYPETPTTPVKLLLDATNPAIKAADSKPLRSAITRNSNTLILQIINKTPTLDKKKVPVSPPLKRQQQPVGKAKLNLPAWLHQDYKDSWLKQVEILAENGDVNAQHNIAMSFYNFKKNKVIDIEKMLYWLRLSADQHHAPAQNALAIFYERGVGVEKDPAEALKLYQLAADQGSIEAHYNIGILYYYGVSLKQNYTEAAKIFQSTASQGLVEAQNMLAICYHDGTGVEKNFKTAVKWHEKAAKKGDDRSQYELSIIYKEGRKGVEKDLKKAFMWCEKSANQGNVMAERSLGLLYYFGEGVERDLKKAVSWFRSGADKGDSESQHRLAICYHNGDGVEKNPVEAANLSKKAAEQQHKRAQIFLAKCYLHGLGVKEDRKEAVRLLQLGAEGGDSESQCLLGGIFALGKGVQQNLGESIKWFKLAAAQGDQKAAMQVELLSREFRI